MARFWGMAFMAQAVLGLGPMRMRDAIRGAVDVVDDGMAKYELERRDAASAAKNALWCFQITNPVMSPEGLVVDHDIVAEPAPVSSSCQLTLMDHVFGNSYGKPFVAKYEPPSCDFNRVVINFTVTSEGRQFDRLATMWLGDTEVWRTSTAEPKAHPGIVWTYWKDMTSYLSLWSQPQTLIFDLGNLVNEKYTGSYKATLTASFSKINLQGPQAPPADQIVPVSTKRSGEGMPSAFSYPGQNAESNVTLPRNIKRAVVSIAANGQADEEFWWSNVPEAGTKTWKDVTLPGLSSFREVRLTIDGNLAGFSWPFPVIFTGGISPPLHRPLVGLQAFDIREHEIDITPWLGILCDGKEHTFSMKVVGESDAVVPNYWVLSAKIFLWLNDEGSVTTGTMPQIKFSEPVLQADVEVMPNRLLRYNQTINRELRITSSIEQNGTQKSKSWTQKFNMVNNGDLRSRGNYQNIEAVYKGEDTAGEADDLLKYYYSSYKYPITARFVTKAPDGKYSMTLNAHLNQGLELVTNGPTAFPNGVEPFLYNLTNGPKLGSNVRTTRSGHAFFYQLNGGKISGGYGDTQQTYELGARSFADPDNPGFVGSPLLYSRNVAIQNETVTADELFVLGSSKTTIHFEDPPPRPLSPLQDQFAPALSDNRGGSRVFTKEQQPANDVEVLGVSSPRSNVEKPVQKFHYKANLGSEKHMIENPP